VQELQCQDKVRPKENSGWKSEMQKVQEKGIQAYKKEVKIKFLRLNKEVFSR